MTEEMHNFHPLPLMTAEDASGRENVGEAVVGASSHSSHLTETFHLLDEESGFSVVMDEHTGEIRCATKQERYHAHRRAHAEAIGRPYPDERHPVWPR